jgi:hypothetical protein
MIMRYRGGGVGHSSTRDAVNHFLNDRHTTDTCVASLATADDESDQSSEESDEELPMVMEFPAEEEPELDEDPSPEGEDDLNLEEEDDYGYQAEVGNSDDEGGEEESNLPSHGANEVLEEDIDDEVEGEIEQLGYARY